MPATAAKPRLIGVSKGSKLDLLGFVTWFTVPDKPVPGPKLKRLWIANTLDPRALPKEAQTWQLFRRAVREQEGRRELPDGTTVQFEVEQVMENQEQVVYQLSRVVKNTEEVVVDYRKSMRVIYGKKSDKINFNILPEGDKRELTPVTIAIRQFMDDNGSMVTGPKVRALIRQYLGNEPDETRDQVGLGGENLRGKAGGVYFVGKEFEDELDGMEAVLKGLYPDNDGYLYRLPCANDQREREMLRERYAENAVSEIEEAMADALQVLDKDKREKSIKSDVKLHHARRLSALRRRAHRYAKLLDGEEVSVEIKLEAMAGLVDRLQS